MEILLAENESLHAELIEVKCELARLKKEHGIHEPSSTGCADDIVLINEGKPTDRPRVQCKPMDTNGDSTTAEQSQTCIMSHGLNKTQAERYSRHMLLPSFGLAAQQRVCAGSALIVGCGGLGSPCALYLAAAGVGTIGLVDHDVVELTNLHRQIIHPEARVGQHKVPSAAESVLALNSSVRVNEHRVSITAQNALALVDDYDVVVDCSDNPPTRYLISDACVVSGKPLVSAAAVGTDGQLSVYCNAGDDVPCYRCLFPEPPPAAGCARCGDAGVLGPVPGVMGVLQALEVLKLLGGVGQPLTRRMLLFDGLAGHMRTVKLRGRSAGCIACGSEPSITRETLPAFDYCKFTGQPAADGPGESLKVLGPTERITPKEMHARMVEATKRGETLPILDVRPRSQSAIMTLPGAVVLPWDEMEARLEDALEVCNGRQEVPDAALVRDENSPGLKRKAEAEALLPEDMAHPNPTEATTEKPSNIGDNGGNRPGHQEVYVICRRGNKSQLAVRRLKQAGVMNIVDIIGGYQAWAEEVDSTMPVI